MPTYSDAAGNQYIGDCLWGNQSIIYPSANFLTAEPYTNLSSFLTTLCTNAGLLFRNVVAQSTINTFANGGAVTFPIYLAFGASGDIDDRITFNFEEGANSLGTTSLYGNPGFDGTTSSTATTNRIAHVGNGGINSVEHNPSSFNISQTNFSNLFYVACANSNSLGLLALQTRLDGSVAFRHNLYYACKLQNINTNYSYYNGSIINQYFILSDIVGGTSFQAINGGHYIASAAKFILQTGDAIYAIACSDGQTPTSQWATDMWVFDNNSTLGFPCIGRVPNMLLGVGTYTYLQHVKIQGSVFPDGGSPWYIPVGTYAGKTLLMRCYSSMA